MKHGRRTILSWLATLPLLSAPPATAQAPNGIVAQLVDGGHVVYFRHAATTRSGVDRIEWPRARQRLLSETGIADSILIGEAFRAHGIPVGEVLASPFARCRDMAELAFGRVEERMELLGLLSDSDGRPGRLAFLRDRMSNPPNAGTNRIIVSHTSNIAEVAGVSLAEGEAVIVQPDGSGFTIIGTMSPGDW